MSFSGTTRRRKDLSMLLSLLLANPLFAFVPAQTHALFALVRSVNPSPFLNAAPIKSIRHGVTSAFSRSQRQTKLRSASSIDDFDGQTTKTENELLRQTVRKLELENERLRESPSRIIIETFEGEGQQRLSESAWYDAPYAMMDSDGITMSGAEVETVPLWCDELDDDTCPIEPTLSFLDALRDRAYWLVGLLALQSCSGFILSRNEALLESHPVIIYFLTMLVGAGGNAGNQASVRGKQIL
jgi:hypothetical protein